MLIYKITSIGVLLVIFVISRILSMFSAKAVIEFKKTKKSSFKQKMKKVNLLIYTTLILTILYTQKIYAQNKSDVYLKLRQGIKIKIDKNSRLWLSCHYFL